MEGRMGQSRRGFLAASRHKKARQAGGVSGNSRGGGSGATGAAEAVFVVVVREGLMSAAGVRQLLWLMMRMMGQGRVVWWGVQARALPALPQHINTRKAKSTPLRLW